jgi:hypothetical protein
MLEPVFQDEKWVVKWITGFVLWILGFLIVPVLIMWGYFVKCIRYGFNRENKLPEFFEDIVKESIDGLMFFAFIFGILLIDVILSAIIGGIIWVVTSIIFKSFMGSFIGFLLGLLIGIFFAVVLYFLLLYLVVSYFAEEKIDFNTGKMIAFAIKQIIPFIIKIVLCATVILAPVGLYYYYYQLGKIYRELNE